MRKIIEYKTAWQYLNNAYDDELDHEVNKFIKEGFELYGNPYLSIKGGKNFVHQAMVKYKEVKEESISNKEISIENEKFKDENKYINRRVETLCISQRALNLLKYKEIKTVKEITNLSVYDLSMIPDAGEKTIAEIIWFIRSVGLDLKKEGLSTALVRRSISRALDILEEGKYKD